MIDSLYGVGHRCKYPPAKLGALLSEPLNAAYRGRCATPVTVASSRNNSKDHNSSPPLNLSISRTRG
jgi:hypothetical protein